jgi:hypothetical protein
VAEADAREKLDLIGLDFLPSPAAVAPLAAAQLGIDEVLVDGNARGEALDDRQNGGPMGFAGGAVGKGHGGIVHLRFAICDFRLGRDRMPGLWLTRTR